MPRPIRRALLSVSDKTGLVDLARILTGTYGVELVATSGTRDALQRAGVPARDVADLTRFPEMLDGRVKTLHPAVYAGILARRDRPDHLDTLAEHGLPEIDLVVCNLYPFEKTVAAPGVTDAQAVEQVDIGGPSMVRAAAKNHAAVTVVTGPGQLARLLAELAEHAGRTTPAFRRALAAEAFEHVARYDRAIADYFARPADHAAPGGGAFLPVLHLSAERKQVLRYGENPHQPAAFYADPGVTRACVATARQLHGKELSYNNILDLDSALNLVREFDRPAAVVVKHNTPCGAAVAAVLADAFDAAWAGDPLSAFGGILAFNRPVDVATADRLATGQKFVECVIAPAFDADAFEVLTTRPTWKKNVRLLATGPLDGPAPAGRDVRRVDGGYLVQERDTGPDDAATWAKAAAADATPDDLAALAFAWVVCKHVKSNAIVLAQTVDGGTAVVGVGAGQMSRVDSTEIAVKKAGPRAAGAVLASDAFFPFPDGIEAAAAAGVRAVVQPGGSLRDADAIAACDRLGVAMVFTGVRHFRH